MKEAPWIMLTSKQEPQKKKGLGWGKELAATLLAFCGFGHVLFQRTGKVTEVTGENRRNPKLGLELTLWYVWADSRVSLASPLCRDLDVDGLSLQEFKLEGSKRKTGLCGCVFGNTPCSASPAMLKGPVSGLVRHMLVNAYFCLDSNSLISLFVVVVLTKSEQQRETIFHFSNST